jgi:hypothetical protein
LPRHRRRTRARQLPSHATIQHSDFGFAHDAR